MKIVTKIRVTTVIILALSWSLGRYANPAWLWIGAFVGVNILQSAFTGFCPAETFFKAMARNKNAGSL
ncbi:DUF2892 domain-containing protein [Kiritimatiellota bacterium B12222]|nr:DUF2892 domain-containing protein [Kiritimatiellota bacterium B12222]